MTINLRWLDKSIFEAIEKGERIGSDIAFNVAEKNKKGIPINWVLTRIQELVELGNLGKRQDNIQNVYFKKYKQKGD